MQLQTLNSFDSEPLAPDLGRPAASRVEEPVQDCQEHRPLHGKLEEPFFDLRLDNFAESQLSPQPVENQCGSNGDVFNCFSLASRCASKTAASSAKRPREATSLSI
jgi:hypothetical protein